MTVCLLTLYASGCATFPATNRTACYVGFDYTDEGVNDQNARALLKHYCICVDEALCE